MSIETRCAIGLIRGGTVRDQAELSRLIGVSRARVTQVMRLLDLAPDIQEAVLGGKVDGRGAELALRAVAEEPEWLAQRGAGPAGVSPLRRVAELGRFSTYAAGSAGEEMVPGAQATIPKVRIFVSSPGDVAEERNIALSAIRELQAEFQGRLDLVPILWEQMPLLASAGFQEEIDRRAPPSKADLALFILWSRLGTPLSQDFELEDGRRPTGTEWEFEEAAKGFEDQGVPHVLVYRKDADPITKANLPKDVLLRQSANWSAVEEFFSRRFQDAADLSFRGSYHTFQTPSEFGQKLRTHLRDELRERLGGKQAEATWHGSPFRGLEPFEAEHAQIFFGRRRAIEEVRQALSRQIRASRAFVLILGASGNGKSSLARAGLLSRLTGPWVAEEDVTTGFCRQAIVRPGDGATPLEALAEALAKEGTLPDLAAQGKASALARAWSKSPEAAVNDVRGALAREAQRTTGGEDPDATGRLVLLVDQLEEVFTREGVGGPERLAFAGVLDALARGGFVWVLATLRSDFYPALSEVPALMSLKEGDGQYDLHAPDEEEIAEIVRLPAEIAGLTYEPDEATGRSLDALLIAEARQGRDALPLLQYALTLLERDKRPDGEMTFAAYEALGGLEGAIGKQADRTWQEIDEEARAAFPRVLRALVDVAEGSEVRATARRAPKALVTHTPGARAFVDAFVAARLLVAEGSAAGETVSVAHEALLRRWERASQQITAEAELLRIQSRLRAEASRWGAAGSPRRWEFWRGRDLEGALLLPRSGFDLEERERTYLGSAAKQTARVRTIKRVAVGAIGALALVAGLLWIQSRRAEKRATGEAERATAEAQRANEERDAKARALTDVERLADAKKVRDLVVEAPKLWPIHPDQAPAMTCWLEQAKAILANRAGHEASRARLREEALLYAEEDRVRDHADDERALAEAKKQIEALDAERTKVEAAEDPKKQDALDQLAAARTKAEAEVERLESSLKERRTWRFDDETTAWKHQVLTDLLADLGRIQAPGDPSKGLLAEVTARHEAATTLRKRSIEDHEQEWTETIAAIAASPKYGGLRITHQLGLVPLGEDPDSHLFEFAHLGSGSIPTRDDKGHFVPGDDDAIVLVLIPGGTFLMGAQAKDPAGPHYHPQAEGDESPVHEVTLSPFFLSKYECTQAEWKAMTGGLDPSRNKAGQNLGDKLVTPRNPVERVSWEDGVGDPGWLTRNRLGLPTEAQWEYACRATTDTPWITGTDVAKLGTVADIGDAYLKRYSGGAIVVTEEVDDGHVVHAPVGSFAANRFGLHDVHGNVYEWCRDLYNPGYYAALARGSEADRRDPPGPQGEGPGYRVLRGGSWRGNARLARSADRSNDLPATRSDNVGFRPARPVNP